MKRFCLLLVAMLISTTSVYANTEVVVNSDVVEDIKIENDIVGNLENYTTYYDESGNLIESFVFVEKNEKQTRSGGVYGTNTITKYEQTYYESSGYAKVYAKGTFTYNSDKNTVTVSNVSYTHSTPSSTIKYTVVDTGTTTGGLLTKYVQISHKGKFTNSAGVSKTITAKIKVTSKGEISY